METICTKDVKTAAAVIRRGGLCAVPTETVYGLAGSGLEEGAVDEIYAVKGRPAVKPLSLMVAGPEAFARYGAEVPAAAYTLAEKFWPGPLTIVVRAAEGVSETVRAGGETVGLRCPDHPLTLELLRETALPLAAPSANPSGAPSPKTAAEVMAYFDGKIPCVLDGGPCGLGKESTIVDVSATPYRILRAGALPENEIFSALTDKLTVIGITGGTGGGKTTALELLREMGALVIDCDQVYHRLLAESESMLAEMRGRFPAAFAGGFDRKRLGQIVFGDPGALAALNAITHRYVCQAVDEALTEHARMGGSLAAIDAIGLIESGLGEKCTAVVGVTAPEVLRIQRLMAREGISREYAAMRIAAQKPESFFREHCDAVLVNDGSLEAFRARCRALLEDIIAKNQNENKN